MEEIVAKDPNLYQQQPKESQCPFLQQPDEEEDGESLVNTTPPSEKKRKKNTGELRKNLKERDEKFLKTLRDKQEWQKAVLSKLIEKLSWLDIYM